MSLREIFNRVTGGKEATPDSMAGLATGSDCPHEADVLAYLQNSASPRKRRRLEKHFGDCGDCRELLTFFARVPDDQADDSYINLTPFNEDAVQKQTVKVLRLIQEDDLNARGLAGARPNDARGEREGKGLYLSYPMLAAAALVFCVIAVGTVFWLTSGPSAEESATQALQAAMKDGRRSLACISGDLPYSEWSMGTRGGGDSDEFQLERALGKLNFADDVSASVKARHKLARVHLAFNKRDHAIKALSILDQLAAGNAQSADVFNDLGVAQFQLREYDRAIESFSKALAISPNYEEALFNRAIANEYAHYIDDALKDFESFIGIASDEQWKAEAERRLKSLPNSTRK